MWGSEDTVLPVGQVEVARRVIPGVRIEVVPGAGHFPHEEFPDRFVVGADRFRPQHLAVRVRPQPVADAAAQRFGGHPGPQHASLPPMPHR